VGWLVGLGWAVGGGGGGGGGVWWGGEWVQQYVRSTVAAAAGKKKKEPGDALSLGGAFQPTSSFVSLYRKERWTQNLDLALLADGTRRVGKIYQQAPGGHCNILGKRRGGARGARQTARRTSSAALVYLPTHSTRI